MRIVRPAAAVALALLALLAIGHNSAAQTASSRLEKAGVASPQTDLLPYTRTVTVTIDSGPILAAALSSYWQTSFTSFSSDNYGPTQQFTLPSDATDITATVIGGTYQKIGNTITFSLTDPVCDFAWAYRTSQKVLRQGNQYQIDQYASTNHDPSFVYISTVFFSATYQVVGQLGPAPEAVTSTSAHWEESVPLNTNDGRHIFSSSMWLIDQRSSVQPDLKIIDKGLTVDTRPGASRAHVTAAIQNGQSIATGAPAYIDIYSRKAPSVPPSGPLDLAGGWCSLDPLAQPDCPDFRSTAGVTNVLKIVEPLQVITLAADLTLTQPGKWDIWLQVDILGGSKGLNLELDESNNWKYVGQVDNPYPVLLPLLVKGH